MGGGVVGGGVMDTGVGGFGGMEETDGLLGTFMSLSYFAPRDI